MFPKTAISIHLRWLFYFPKHKRPGTTSYYEELRRTRKTYCYKELARYDLLLRGTQANPERPLITGNSHKPGTTAYYEELILRGT